MSDFRRLSMAEVMEGKIPHGKQMERLRQKLEADSALIRAARPARLLTRWDFFMALLRGKL